jgi:hypothetical protein
MGLVGLVAGIAYYYSGGFGSRPPQPSHNPKPSSEAVPPAQLIGLGYLPADVSIAFAIQPSPIAAYAERTKQEPRELLLKAGLPRQFLDAIENLGLTLNNDRIDHIAGGATVAELRITLVLVLRRPFDDEREVLRRLRANRQNTPKERYSVEIGGVPLTLAQVAPTIWVFGFDAKDLAAVERGGYGAGGTQFAPGLVEMIGRVPADAAAWVATNDDRWDDKELLQFALGLGGKKDVAGVLAKGRAAVAALSFADPPRLHLFVKAADPPTAEQVRAYFAKRAAADEQIRHGGAGELAMFNTPIDPTALADLFRQMLSDALKK